ncbi:MAG: DUF167 domain-containing protein [Nanoarchaeota archaeon]|nr:DUF167 domain-containing protein [Nanoarchaeota archaeon]MBU1103076.1 DUF167 domain-containing protein [Nanoarchaeota archaeon]
MILKIKVKPNSSRDSLEKISPTEYKAELKAPPQNNKANLALIKLLAKEFSVPQSKIKIKNPSSRKKVVEIQKNK